MKIAETFEKICKRIVSSPKRTHNSCSLQPITFDTNVHGDNVKISTDGLLAKRNQSFCKAIVFSNRALLIGEEISIVVTSVSDSWSGSLRFGFCNKNPLNLKSKLPKYMCPDLTSVPGCFARALHDDETKIGTLLTFWLNEHGQIMYRVNNKLRGVFLNVEYPHINVPMWAMIDVYGLVTSVKIISGDNFMISKKALSTRSINDLTINFNNFNLNENTFSSSPQHWPIQNNPINFSTSQHSKPVSKYYANVNFNRMQLSETVGANIKLNNSRTIASRKLLTANQGYVFTKRPLNSNEKLVIQILKADPLFNGNLGFGLTTCNPLTLNSNDLPEDSHNLLNRPEYWLVIKDVLVNAKTGDELGFMINNSNQVQLTKNDLPPVTLMHVDSTQNFYAFFDLHGKTTKIQVLGTYQEQRLSITPNQFQMQINNYYQNLTQANRSNRFSELNQLNNSISCKKIFQSLKSNKPQQQIKLINSNSKLDQETQNANGECTICFEKSINCVLYQCGHCCMCYDCAIRLYANAGARCPICRASIQDVIRTYWS